MFTTSQVQASRRIHWFDCLLILNKQLLRGEPQWCTCRNRDSRVYRPISDFVWHVSWRMPCVDVVCLILLMISFISQAWTFSTNQWLPYKIIITTLLFDPWPRLACAIFVCVDLWSGCARVGTLIWSGIWQDKMNCDLHLIHLLTKNVVQTKRRRSLSQGWLSKNNIILQKDSEDLLIPGLQTFFGLCR